MTDLKKLFILMPIFNMVLGAKAQHLAMNEVDIKKKEAIKYLKGTTNQPVDYVKYFEITKQCAESGDAKSMYNLAECYLNGVGIKTDISKAISWYNAAGNKKIAKAYFRLGYGYKKGLFGDPDYKKAYEYFSKSADMDYPNGIYYKAYMLYTGLGCTQDYFAAYPLFQKTALKGNPNAMRFVGLSMRNGYGTQVNSDSAIYWLRRASQFGNGMSDDELKTDQPENADLAGTLVDKIKAAQNIIKTNYPVNTFTKIKQDIRKGDFAGTYEGWLLKYDWSGQHVVKADKLNVVLKFENDSIKGIWTENDTLSLPIKANLANEELLFTGMQYEKRDHYYLTTPELLKFKSATLQLIKESDTSYLFGNLQLFSSDRNEPAKPMYVALKQIYKEKNNLGEYITQKINAYPNPFIDIVNLDFELKKECEVQVSIFTISGEVVYSKGASTLEAGDYILPIQTQYIVSGTYILKLQCGKSMKTIKIVKL